MRRKRIVVAVVVFLLLLAAVAATLWAVLSRRGERSGRLAASGTVEATEAQAGFEVTGRLESVLVHEGDTVRAGQALARLDRSEMAARRAQAAAQVAAAQAQLAELMAGTRREEVAQGRAAQAAARDKLADAERDAGRTKTLFDGGAVSRETYDKALLARDLARSQGRQAEEQLRLLQNGPTRERRAAARAQLEQARAALAARDVTLAHMTLAAPFDGVVTVRHREPGETVAPGAPVLTIINPGDRWVRIYVREDRVGAVKLGSRATITSDTFPGKSYEGAVRFIASEAEFTPKNVQTQEERVKLVYAVKVQIVGDPGLDLKPGLPADVRLEAGRS
jgi:membrane fusion protein YbhG